MELLERFKTVRNEMREYLETKLVEYCDAIDNSQFDKAHEIRQSILPYSHMFYAAYRRNIEYMRKIDGLDLYDVVRFKKEEDGVTRLDLFMENYLKANLLYFDPCPDDHKNQFLII